MITTESRKLINCINKKTSTEILTSLSKSEANVMQLMFRLRKGQSLISQHLMELRRYGMVQSRPEGKKRYYSLTAKGRDLLRQLSSVSMSISEMINHKPVIKTL